MFFNYEYQGNVPLLIIFFFFSQHLLDNELISVLFFFCRTENKQVRVSGRRGTGRE